MIKRIKISSILISVFLSAGIVLSGCSHNDTAQNPQDVISTEATETIHAEAETEKETKTITISVLNLSNIPIGMFSVIDPATGEQINLDSLKPGQSVTMDCNWPADVSQFQWALYNESGELCMDASTDISKAQKSVALILSGEDTIEDVNAVFDDGTSDSE